MIKDLMFESYKVGPVEDRHDKGLQHETYMQHIRTWSMSLMILVFVTMDGSYHDKCENDCHDPILTLFKEPDCV